MRIGSGPPGPSIVSSRTAAMSAGFAISAMRASYCARAAGTANVCVAGTPVPLSNNAWICGSTGIASPVELLRRVRQPSRFGRCEPVEHLARPLGEFHVVASVEDPGSVDEDAMHPDRVADRPWTAARQIIDPARRRDADRGRIEQQEVGAGADGDAAPVGNAIEPGLMAGQAAHPLYQIEGAAIAHPMSEEIEPEPGIAEIEEMRAGIR